MSAGVEKNELAVPRAGTLQSNRLAGLDLLRLVAALGVVAYHFCFRGYTGAPQLVQVGYPELAGAARYGFLGVDLFFIISGFVIAASAQGRSWTTFGIARAARLYPAFLVCMTTTAFVLAIAGNEVHTATAVQWTANLIMVPRIVGQSFMDGAYWSIVLEIVFYGWVALFIACGLFERRLLTIITVWLVVAALNEHVLGIKALRWLLLTEYGPLFASGVLMQRIHRGIAGPATWGLLAAAFLLAGWRNLELPDISPAPTAAGSMSKCC